MNYSKLHYFFKLLVAIIATATLLCSNIAVAEELQQKPTYIPRSILFAPPDVMAIKISPNGKFLAYVKGEHSGVMNLYICPTNKCLNPDSLKQITHFTAPEIYRFFWTDDSKHIVFLQDHNGAQRFQLYTINIQTGDLINHTKDFKNISTKIFKISGSKVAVGINDRNSQYHDIFIFDTQTGTLHKIFENDRFSRFIFDEDLNIAFKEHVHEDGAIDIYKDENIYMHFSPEDAFHSRLLKVQNGILYYVDSRNADTTFLKTIDLKTGKENKLAHNLKSDIGDIIFINGRSALYATTWLKKEWHSLGTENVDFLQKNVGSSFEVVSQSKNYWIIRTSEPKRIGASFYLYHRDNEEITALHVANTDPQLADMIPFEFEARDGLKLNAYLTLPPQFKSLDSIKQPIPLIVFPHGGPFQHRDTLGFNPRTQWLASRGYAVLAINFRSSSGLGKKLVNAGNGEWGRKALYDLIDGANWCIKQGITTKSQIGIMGGSYGGYATLAALTFMPKEFVVGVDIVGPSSLITVLEKVPAYWDFPSYPLSDSEVFFTKGAFVKNMGGNPQDAEGRRYLASHSPLHFSQQIERPILLIHGDNDPIVNKNESRQIFAKLKSQEKKTCLLSFPDEGHQFKRYANIDMYLAYAEKWLHDSLGGAFEPINPQSMKESSVVIEQ